MGAVVEVPHVLSYPVARKTVAREALTCGNAAVSHNFANSLYYICDPLDVTLQYYITAAQRAKCGRNMAMVGTSAGQEKKHLSTACGSNLKPYHISNTVKLHLSGLIETAGHPDMQ
jgi:hypothetical protein